jgi:hypothetical protein
MVSRSPVHARVDIERWRNMFPLTGNDLKGSVHQVTSPAHAAKLLQLRHHVLGGDRPDLGLPVDIVVFCLGEPERRETTKVGGLPFRARAKNWPKRKGTLLTFFGQICFSDSSDIVGELPGEVLLIFGDPENALGRHARFHCEWVSLDEGENELVGAADVPPLRDGSHAIVPSYGQLWRTYDYPTSAALFSNLRGHLAVSEATKIGGTPFLVQGDEPPPDDTYLGVIASVQPEPDVAYPWINVPDPIVLGDLYKSRYFQIGDMGSLYVWMDEYGKVKVKSDCY